MNSIAIELKKHAAEDVNGLYGDSTALCSTSTFTLYNQDVVLADLIDNHALAPPSKADFMLELERRLRKTISRQI